MSFSATPIARFDLLSSGLAQQAIAAFGYITLDSFEDGNTLTLPNQVLRLEATGEYYRWDGVFPKVVPAGSTQDSTGGIGTGAWLSVGDATLRGDLAQATGAGMVNTTLVGTVQEKLEDVLSAQYRDRNIKLLAQFQYKCRTKQNVTILCQGDSITAGMDTTSTDVTPPDTGDAEVNPTITHATITYPARLGVFLNYASGIPVSIIKRGVSGHTAKKSHEYWTSKPNADIVFIMFGINDADPANGTHKEYMQYMELLIRRYVDWGIGVVVMTCASGGVGRTDPLYQKFSQQAKAMATVYGCAHFNANEVLYYMPQGAVEADGVHLNSAGYAKLGEAVAGFIMAGCVLDAYKPLSQQTYFWPSMQSDTIGFYDVKGNFETYYNDGSYILQAIVGRMVAGQPSRISFSFYLDADAAEVEVIGSWSDLDVVVGMTSEHVNTGIYPPYYGDVNPRSSRYQDTYSGQSFQVALRDRSGGKLNGLPRIVGSLVGRGWKTITFQTREDTGSTNNVFIQGVTVRPISLSLAQEDYSGNSVLKGTDEVYRQTIPHRSNQEAGGAPSPLQLNGASFPLPKTLYGLSFDNNTDYFDCGIVEITVRCVGGTVGNGLVKYTAYKNATGNGLSLIETYRSGNSNMPSIANISIQTRPKAVKNAASSFAPNMPLKNIYEAGTPVSAINASSAGRVLAMTFDYPTANTTGYWYLEVRGAAVGSGEFCATAF
ncbi:hypothetical protein DBW29_05785 [Salmonella enterica subsp. enterica]|nr:hypothetical protein [Salmonella enterica]EBN1736669.1 hypothetical protein [Salmonella enterica subsp. enterica]